MKHLLDRICKELQDNLRRNFPRYIIRVYKQKDIFMFLLQYVEEIFQTMIGIFYSEYSENISRSLYNAFH